MKKLILGLSFLLLAGLSVADNPRMDRGDHDTGMRWYTGGVCDTPIDCALTSINFCAQHGGVAVMSFDGEKRNSFGCTTRCNDATTGHAACTSHLEEADGGVDDTEEEPDSVVHDPCKSGFIGPPDPTLVCPCDGPDCT